MGGKRAGAGREQDIMIPQREKNVIRKRVHVRIREKLAGSAERPRLNVYRSLNHIYAQLIDDQAGTTIVSASTNEKAEAKGAKTKAKRTGGNVASAKAIVKMIAE